MARSNRFNPDEGEPTQQKSNSSEDREAVRRKKREALQPDKPITPLPTTNIMSEEKSKNNQAELEAGREEDEANAEAFGSNEAEKISKPLSKEEYRKLADAANKALREGSIGSFVKVNFPEINLHPFNKEVVLAELDKRMAELKAKTEARPEPQKPTERAPKQEKKASETPIKTAAKAPEVPKPPKAAKVEAGAEEVELSDKEKAKRDIEKLKNELTKNQERAERLEKVIKARQQRGEVAAKALKEAEEKLVEAEEEERANSWVGVSEWAENNPDIAGGANITAKAIKNNIRIKELRQEIDAINKNPQDFIRDRRLNKIIDTEIKSGDQARVDREQPKLTPDQLVKIREEAIRKLEKAISGKKAEHEAVEHGQEQPKSQPKTAAEPAPEPNIGEGPLIPEVMDAEPGDHSFDSNEPAIDVEAVFTRENQTRPGPAAEPEATASEPEAAPTAEPVASEVPPKTGTPKVPPRPTAKTPPPLPKTAAEQKAPAKKEGEFFTKLVRGVWRGTNWLKKYFKVAKDVDPNLVYEKDFRKQMENLQFAVGDTVEFINSKGNRVTGLVEKVPTGTNHPWYLIHHKNIFGSAREMVNPNKVSWPGGKAPEKSEAPKKSKIVATFYDSNMKTGEIEVPTEKERAEIGVGDVLRIKTREENDPLALWKVTSTTAEGIITMQQDGKIRTISLKDLSRYERVRTAKIKTATINTTKPAAAEPAPEPPPITPADSVAPDAETRSTQPAQETEQGKQAQEDKPVEGLTTDEVREKLKEAKVEKSEQELKEEKLREIDAICDSVNKEADLIRSSELSTEEKITAIKTWREKLNALEQKYEKDTTDELKSRLAIRLNNTRQNIDFLEKSLQPKEQQPVEPEPPKEEAAPDKGIKAPPENSPLRRQLTLKLIEYKKRLEARGKNWSYENIDDRYNLYQHDTLLIALSPKGIPDISKFIDEYETKYRQAFGACDVEELLKVINLIKTYCEGGRGANLPKDPGPRQKVEVIPPAPKPKEPEQKPKAPGEGKIIDVKVERKTKEKVAQQESGDQQLHADIKQRLEAGEDPRKVIEELFIPYLEKLEAEGWKADNQKFSEIIDQRITETVKLIPGLEATLPDRGEPFFPPHHEVTGDYPPGGRDISVREGISRLVRIKTPKLNAILRKAKVRV